MESTAAEINMIYEICNLELTRKVSSDFILTEEKMSRSKNRKCLHWSSTHEVTHEDKKIPAKMLNIILTLQSFLECDILLFSSCHRLRLPGG